MGKRFGGDKRRLARGLVILHEDDDILVVDKPAGLLTIGTESEKSRTAYFVLTDYIRKGAPRSRRRVFIVHRLDRDTSGVLVVAKNETAKFRLQERWHRTKKTYLAVVHGHCSKRAGTITSYLTESKAHVVYSTPDPTQGKLARTGYRVLKQARDFALLEVDLLTGRKNQIRVHLADIGHAVVGDRKYGNQRGPYRHLALHSQRISLEHPTSGKWLTFVAKVPEYFAALVGSVDLGECPREETDEPPRREV